MFRRFGLIAMVFAIAMLGVAAIAPPEAEASGGRVFVGGRGRTVIVNRGFNRGANVHVGHSAAFFRAPVHRSAVFFAPPVVAAPAYAAPVVAAPVYSAPVAAPTCGVGYGVGVGFSTGGCGSFFGY